MPKTIQIGQALALHARQLDGAVKVIAAVAKDVHDDGSVDVLLPDHGSMVHERLPVLDADGAEGHDMWLSLPVELLDFGVALALMKAGKTVTRLGEMSRITLPAGATHLVVDGQAAWRPSDEDLLADDWVLVEEEAAL